jgi:hypothetical protein
MAAMMGLGRLIRQNHFYEYSKYTQAGHEDFVFGQNGGGLCFTTFHHLISCKMMGKRQITGRRNTSIAPTTSPFRILPDGPP